MKRLKGFALRCENREGSLAAFAASRKSSERSLARTMPCQNYLQLAVLKRLPAGCSQQALYFAPETGASSSVAHHLSASPASRPARRLRIATRQASREVALERDIPKRALFLRNMLIIIKLFFTIRSGRPANIRSGDQFGRTNGLQRGSSLRGRRHPPADQGKNRYSRYPACDVAEASMKSLTGTSPFPAIPAEVLTVPPA